MGDGYAVGQLAELAGVTVRTLHHYDDVGLLRPSARTSTGYRVYDATDVERLHQILMYRRLGFGLQEIAALVDDPAIDAVAHLRQQRALLVARGEELSAMVAAIDRQLEARRMGMQLTPKEQMEVFGTDKVGGEWADEAKERWGQTEAYQESQRRAASYSKDDWQRLKAESDAALRAWADIMRSGASPTSAQATAAAEAHREFINRWFYDCSYDVHRGLALMYVEDPRFTEAFESVAPGL